MEANQWKQLLGYSYHAPRDRKKEAFLFSVSRAGCTLCNENFEIKREGDYGYYALHILLDGYGFFQIADRSYFLKKGDIFLIPPGQAHMYCNSSSSSLVLLWIELSGGSLSEIFSYFRSTELYTLQNASGGKLESKLTDILRGLKAGNGENLYEQSGEVYVLLMYLLETAREVSVRKLPDLVADALTYIDDNFTGQIRIKELAGRLHISQTYLNRLFHRSLGITPMKYVSMKRIEYACYLLQNSSLSCEKISEKAGMYDNAYFYKIFKSVMGMTPVQYREGVEK